MGYSRPFDLARQAILASIIYSDIFSFPLKGSELWKFLTTGKKITKNNFDTALLDLRKNYISEKDGYFCLKGREKIIEKRKMNTPEVDRKLRIAKKASFYLSHISSIQFIGISGGLAMGDVEKQDDIDIFVITKKNTIFKSRLLILFLLELIHLRRKRQDANPTDKICVNFLIDEKNLSFSKEKQDVYTAHEILQIKPLYGAQNTFSNFLKSNKWINNFFSNSEVIEEKIPKINKNFILKIIFHILDHALVEKICRFLQILIINKHRKNEIVTNHVLVFNPNDYRIQTSICY